MESDQVMYNKRDTCVCTDQRMGSESPMIPISASAVPHSRGCEIRQGELIGKMVFCQGIVLAGMLDHVGVRRNPSRYAKPELQEVQASRNQLF